MKKDMLTIIRKEFARFFGEKRMVFTTMLMPGLLIYLIYTLMGQGMMQVFTADDSYALKVYERNLPEELVPVLEEISADWTRADEEDIEEIKSMIRDKEADVLIVFPENFVAEAEAYDVRQGGAAPNVEIYYNSTEPESAHAMSALSGLLNAYEDSMINKFDINAGETEYNMATERDVTGQLFAMLLPMLLITFMYSGCVAVAPESIAGEKERGTIATLLVTPMKRSSLALGKIISLSCIALLSGISSFAGTLLSLPALLGGEETGMNANVYGFVDYALLLVIILSTVLVLVAVIAVVSAFAKSIKEAGTAISPLMILVMLVGLAPMLAGDGEKSLGVFLIPVYNSVQCMHGIFSFTYEPLQVVVTMLVNLVCTGLLAGVLTKLFNSERVMFTR